MVNIFKFLPKHYVGGVPEEDVDDGVLFIN